MGKLTGLAKEQRRTLDRLSTVPRIRDLSAMKLAAIARRGLRRDFGD